MPATFPLATSTPTPEPVEQLKDAVDKAPEVLQPWVAVLVPLGLAAVVVAIGSFVVGQALRKVPTVRAQAHRLRLPVFFLLSALALLITTANLIKDEFWALMLSAGLKAVLIIALTWTIVIVLNVAATSLLDRPSRDGRKPDPGQQAKMATQVGLLKRVITAVVIVCGVAGVLLLVPAVQKLGAGILASAGLASVIVGLAVQGVLANVFAGLQLAFTNAIRMDDMVVVNGQQGRVKEITLTYVVVGTADGRSIILPSTFFTTEPFENWTRGSAELKGNVVLELSWRAPVDVIRRRVTQLLNASDLWDGREGSTQVTMAQGGNITVTITLSARNSGDLYTLKNEIREKLIADLQSKYPDALPRTPLGAADAGGTTAGAAPAGAAPLSPSDVAPPTSAFQQPTRPRGSAAPEPNTGEQGTVPFADVPTLPMPSVKPAPAPEPAVDAEAPGTPATNGKVTGASSTPAALPTAPQGMTLGEQLERDAHDGRGDGKDERRHPGGR